MSSGFSTVPDLAHNAHDYNCLCNAVIGWSLSVCLGVEHLEQWYAYRHYFLCSSPRTRLMLRAHLAFTSVRLKYAKK